MQFPYLKNILLALLLFSLSSSAYSGFKISELKKYIDAGGTQRSAALLYLHGLTLGVMSELSYLHKAFDPVYAQIVRDLKKGSDVWRSDDLKTRLGALASARLCFPKNMRSKDLQKQIVKWFDRYSEEVLARNADADAYALVKIGLVRDFSCLGKGSAGAGIDAYDEDEEYEPEPDIERQEVVPDDGLDEFEESDGYG